MEKRFLITIIPLIFAILSARTYAQEVIPKGIVEVIAVKGEVVFNRSKLKKGDKIEFKPNVGVMNQLIFSSATDWIKVMEINSRKVHHYYKQKKYACPNCLFTRRVYFDNTARIGLFDYFNRKLIFLFEPDTIILLRKDINSNPNNIAVFQISIDGKIYNRIVGGFDTIIMSHDRLFGFADDEKILWPSFQTDSIRLIYYDRDTHIQAIPELPYFHVKFIEDAVNFFLNMKMDSEEIYMELIENFVDVKNLMVKKGFDDQEVTKKWIKEYTERILSKSVK